MQCQRDEVLAVDRVSVSFSGRPVLREVTFSLGAGEFCGLIGTNGAGKTTLLRTILGFQAPLAGRVRVDRASDQDGLPAIGYVPQKITLDSSIPVRARDVVALGLDGHRFGLSFSTKKRQGLVAEMLAAVGAEKFADQRVGNLSGGEQQRVLIAHALIRRPRLLLLDEPLANLDMRSAAEIASLLRRLSVEHRITVLLSTHDMNPLLPLMDRVVYLANGRAASGATDDVIRTDVLSRLYGYHIDVVRVHDRILVVAAEAPEEIPAAVEKYPAHVAQIP